MPEITTVQETITPDLAQEYLKRNQNGNRTINMSNVRKYVRDMKNGRFKTTHQGIAFDEAGNLIDGQHRLTAIVQAGVPVNMMVTRNLPADTFSCIDRGYNRTFANCASISNPGDDTMSRAMRDGVMSAAVRQIATCTIKQKMAISTGEVMKLYETFAPQIESVYNIMSARRSGCHRSQVLSAAITALYSGVTTDAIEKFFNVFKLADITDCASFNPNAAIQWRRVLDNSRRNGGYLSARKVYLGTQNAIYNFVNANSVQNAKIPEKPRYDISGAIKPIFTEV